MIKKILSPIFYTLLFIPLFVGTIWIISALEDSIGFLFQTNGFIEISLIILSLGTVLFFYGSHSVCQFEQLRSPSKINHFRQSAFYYLVALYGVISLFSVKGTGSLGGAYLFMITFISLWAILMNAFYLFRQSVNK